MTATPRSTASLIAPVTLPASVQEIRIASAPSFTACSIRCACTWPSSCGGVSQATWMVMPSCRDSSLAAASAPVRAARNTGFVELFAISAMVMWSSSRARPSRRASRLPPHAAAPTAARAASQYFARLLIRDLRSGVRRRVARRPRTAAQAPRREPGAPLVQRHREDDGGADDDPFVVLIEVQRPDRLADQHDQHGAERRAERAALAPDQAGTADHCRRDHVQLVALRVRGRSGPEEPGPEERREPR